MLIQTIYFLGHKLEHIKVPVIKVNRQYYDVTTGKELKEREEFIESLTHDSYVIQIPYLRQQHRTELEQLLYVFDQRNLTANQQVLEIKETDFPDKLRPLIRRLQRAIREPEIRRKMDAEDEILEELEELEREIERKEQLLEQKNQMIGHKDQIIGYKDKIIDEKDKIIAELQRKLEGQ
ncbi:hypothetical protein JW964_10215 [candidate division KSB1 bacterium]|nr:hypothetical protein [candidate division KSB1 bacterium]